MKILQLVIISFLCSTTVYANAVFTNEPGGLTPLADTIWNATAPDPGTSNDPWRLSGGNGIYISSDNSAPLSQGLVLTEKYPIGFGDGASPGTTTFRFSPNGLGTLQKEVFVGFYWKASDPYQQHPAGLTKIAFIVRSGNSNGQEIIRMGGNKEPYRIDVNSEYGGTPPTVTKAPNRANVPINLGQWYKIEWYTKGESSVGASDGIVRWWVDGQLVGDYSNVVMDTTTFMEFKFSSTWGGNSGAVKNETDYFWIDHTYLAGSPGTFGINCGNNVCTNHESCLSCPTDCCAGGTPPPAVCGNGIVESGEQCDLGSSNGVCPSTCSGSCTTQTCTPIPKTGDLNGDGVVNILDVQRVVSKLGQSGVTTGEDVNADNAVDIFDLVTIARNWG